MTFVADRFVFFDLNLETANRWKAAILRLKSANRPVTVSARLARSAPGAGIVMGAPGWRATPPPGVEGMLGRWWWWWWFRRIV